MYVQAGVWILAGEEFAESGLHREFAVVPMRAPSRCLAPTGLLL